MVAAFEKASGQKLPTKIAPRRAGDLPEFWANPTKANKVLKWQTKLTIADAMNDTINYLRHEGKIRDLSYAIELAQDNTMDNLVSVGVEDINVALAKQKTGNYQQLKQEKGGLQELKDNLVDNEQAATINLLNKEEEIDG